MTASNPAPLAPDAPWIVLKFGGTSVATADRWRTILRIASERRAEGMRVVVVVSAMAGVTDALRALCACPVAEREAGLAELAARHRELAAQMQLADADRMEHWLASLRALIFPPAPGTAAIHGPELRGGATASGGGSEAAATFVGSGPSPQTLSKGERGYSWQAAVQAHGELLSSSLGAAFMSANGLPTRWLDARDVLLARELPFLNERARALSAQVQVEPDPAFAAKLAAEADVVMVPGFMARNGAGHTVLLGRGGTDTSAAHFGALLRATRVEIWTDVAGMFTADPRQVPGARLLQRLDYDEAQEVATTGAKVLHPRCLSPCRRVRVPLWVKDTRRPELDGTVIAPQPAEAAPSIKAISSRRGITLVSMETSGMWQQVGFLADVFALFKRHGLSVDLIGSAETNVTVSLDPNENLLDSDLIAALAADLAKVCRVKVIAPCAAVTLVGRGMRSMLHRLSGVLAEFGHMRVHLISQSSNNLNLTFVVDEGMLDGLLPRLHELLIRAGALRTDDVTLFGPSWRVLYGEAETRVRTPWWRDARETLLALAGNLTSPSGRGGKLATPRYVYHLATIRDRARALRAMHSVDRVYYAVKANAHPAILQALAGEGLGLECVSPGELDAVDAIAEAHESPRLFTPNFAPRGDYESALRNDGPRSPVPGPVGFTPSPERLLTLDSLHPLQHWSDLFGGREVLLRVDLGRGLGHHDKVRTGGATSKFGLPLDQFDAFLALARKHDVRIIGLHAHLGSGILDASHWPNVCGQLASLAERTGSARVLDLGGGLGVPSHPGEAELDLAAVDAALAEVKHAYPQYEFWLEPGRWLVADAGVLLAKVTQTKRKGGIDYLGCDAGMHALIRPALYDAWHQIANLTRIDAPRDTLYQVVGPICETGDVLGADRLLPSSEEGDVLLIAQAGAYGESMASHYNLRYLAESAVIE
ncbi:MAG TPA: bifunctional aspartate kinase/diaminopimelate decarboxylase [Rhodanobacteraceae bacterium]|nr:bifunctional aspartate kinase/diaminopimelate decarboxylase [Rhodanobacteraceae bacterium]